LNIRSPLARAPIGKDAGDSVEVRTPGGEKSYEVLSIGYVCPAGHGGVEMSDGQQSDGAGGDRSGFGLYSRSSSEPAVGPAEVIAGVVSLIWLALAGGFFLFAGDGGSAGGSLGTVMVLVAIFLPLALIWIAVVTLRTARAMKDETQRLQ